jgi:hypothetical protein
VLAGGKQGPDGWGKVYVLCTSKSVTVHVKGHISYFSACLNWPDSGSCKQRIAKCNKLARSGEEGRRALEADWWRESRCRVKVPDLLGFTIFATVRVLVAPSLSSSHNAHHSQTLQDDR